MDSAFVAEILLRRGLVPAEELEGLRTSAEERGASLLDVIRVTRTIEENALVQALADEMGMPVIEKIETDEVPEELVEQTPINFARQQKVLPYAFDGDAVRVALSNPLDLEALDDLRALLGRRLRPVVTTTDAIDDAINRVYDRTQEAELGADHDDEEDELQDLLDANDEAPIIRFVNNLFYNSVREGASDIHIEPLDDKVIVRYRIDGRLEVKREAPKGALASIVSRIKIEAGLNIAEKRLPQDGRITKKIRGKVIDVRVSTIPTAKGESIVMRLLDKDNIKLDLTDLGFARRELDHWGDLVERPDGIVLITGPTGSGKTTTLYASLNRINQPDVKILTAENPVEYELRGINQLQVHAKIGLTFAAALRAFLRQDPDVIMVGEIRDQETAELAIQASLTGHLVLSTLHTNDAPGAINRLVDMGIQPFQISSTVLGVLAQRLVRRLCPHCKEPYQATREHLMELGMSMEHLDTTLAQLEAAAATTVLGRNSSPPTKEAAPAIPPGATTVNVATGIVTEREMDEAAAMMAHTPDSRLVFVFPDAQSARRHAAALEARNLGWSFEESMDNEVTQVLDLNAMGVDPFAASTKEMSRTLNDGGRKMPTFYRPVGCEHCRGGYKGRLGIFELMLVNPEVRAAILRRDDSKTLAKIARGTGMRQLRDDGARQVIAGVTSIEEVLAATQAGLEEEAAE